MRLRRTALAAVLFAAVSAPLAGTAVAAPDRDCADFASQAEAQAAFDAVPGDPERLDGDNDGQACEETTYSTASTPGAVQVAAVPAGAVAAGDGSTAADGSGPLPYVLGGLAFAGAGGAALAARRSSRVSA